MNTKILVCPFMLRRFEPFNVYFEMKFQKSSQKLKVKIKLSRNASYDSSCHFSANL